MLTRKQRELLHFIKARLDEDGVPPSFDEMKEALDLKSKSGIHRLITALEERGFIRRLAHRARALEIIKLPDAMEREGKEAAPAAARPVAAPPRPPAATAAATAAARAPRDKAPLAAENARIYALELPVMGRIAAGVPIEAISEVSHHIAVPGGLVSGRGNHYALEVKGDSMIEAGINDGDIVVIREQDTAENGEIVVALIEETEATLKRFRRNGSDIELEAANPAYETRILRANQVRVQGRLVGLIRNY